MHSVNDYFVRLMEFEDGEPLDSTVVHALVNSSGLDMTLCEGVVVGKGDSGTVFEYVTEPQKGEVCPECRSILKGLSDLFHGLPAG